MKIKNLFKQAWKMVRKNPLFWILGFFAAFLVNNEINLIIVNFKKINSWIDQLVVLDSFQLSFKSILGLLFPYLKAYYFLILFAVIGLALIYISIRSQISIILSVIKNPDKQIIKASWKESKKTFFPVFLIYLIFFVVIYGFLLLLTFPFVQNLPFLILFYIIVYLVLVLLGSFISRFAVLFIITEKQKTFQAIKNGFSFFFKNFLVICKNLAFISLVTIILGMGLFLASICTAIPFIILINLFIETSFSVGFWIVFVFYSILILGLVLVISSIFSVWQICVWTLLFKELKTSRKLVDKTLI